MQNSKTDMENSIKNKIIENEISNIKNEIIQNVTTELKNADIDLKKSNIELFQQEQALKTTLAEEKHRKQIFDEECAQERQNMKTEFETFNKRCAETREKLEAESNNLLMSYENRLKSITRKSGIFADEMKHQTYDKTLQSKEYRSKLVNFARVLFYSVKHMLIGGDDINLLYTDVICSICDWIETEDITRGDKRKLVKICYELITSEKNDEEIESATKNQLEQIFPLEDERTWWKEFDFKHMRGLGKKRDFVLDDSQIKELYKARKIFREGQKFSVRPLLKLLSKKGYRGRKDIFLVISCIEAVINEDERYIETKKSKTGKEQITIYASPFNPYVLDIQLI